MPRTPSTIVAIRGEAWQLLYFGEWPIRNEGDNVLRYSRVRFATCALSFRGTSVAWVGPVGPDQGRSDVFVDGELRSTVDGYAAEREPANVRFTVSGLEPDRIHTIRVVVRGDRHDDAVDSLTTIGGFEASEPLHYPTELRRRKNAEYALIRGGTKPFVPAGEWVPVPDKARAPERGVTLGRGFFREIFDRNIAYLNHCFAQDGYASSASDQELLQGGPGWSRLLPGSMEGRMLSGAAGALRWEERADLRTIVDTIVSDIAARVRDDGYFNYYPDDNFDAGETAYGERKNYDRVFWTRGMLAAGLAGDERVYPILRGMYDWFNTNEHLPFMLEGANATNGLPGGPLVYLSPVGVEADLVVSKRYFDQDFWFTELANGEPMSFTYYPGNKPHCYDLLGLEAAVDEYRGTGEQKYLDAALGGWRAYRENFLHIGGSSAICEDEILRYFPRSYFLNKGHTGEACGSSFWINVNRKLLSLEPDRDDYAAEIEESLLNVLAAAQDDRGYLRYHAKLHGSKQSPQCVGTCCEVSTVGVLSRLPEFLYSLDDDGVFVNMYTASSVDWAGASGSARLTTTSAFPTDSAVTIEVAADQPIRLVVRLRIPKWTSGPVEVLVNDSPTAVGTPGEYLSLDRTWADGDRISFDLPMHVTAREYSGIDQLETGERRYALQVGPVLLALLAPVTGPDDVPRLDLVAATIADHLVPTGEALEFAVAGHPDLRFIPYWKVEAETFTCFPVLR